jgi:hypothetical protein
MAHYVWELGFDFDHLDGHDGTCDLQLGLVKDADGWKPASPYLIKAGETVAFHIYDLTDELIGIETTLSSVVIEFSAAREGDRQTPFNDDEIALNPTFVPGDGEGNLKKTSSYFSKERPVYSPEGKKEWTVHAAAEHSHLNMMVTVIVTKKFGELYRTRKFVVDPEMVIDSHGETDPPS